MNSFFWPSPNPTSIPTIDLRLQKDWEKGSSFLFFFIAFFGNAAKLMMPYQIMENPPVFADNTAAEEKVFFWGGQGVASR